MISKGGLTVGIHDVVKCQAPSAIGNMIRHIGAVLKIFFKVSGYFVMAKGGFYRVNMATGSAYVRRVPARRGLPLLEEYGRS